MIYELNLHINLTRKNCLSRNQRNISNEGCSMGGATYEMVAGSALVLLLSIVCVFYLLLGIGRVYNCTRLPKELLEGSFNDSCLSPG